MGCRWTDIVTRYGCRGGVGVGWGGGAHTPFQPQTTNSIIRDKKKLKKKLREMLFWWFTPFLKGYRAMISPSFHWISSGEPRPPGNFQPPFGTGSLDGGRQPHPPFSNPRIHPGFNLWKTSYKQAQCWRTLTPLSRVTFCVTRQWLE